MFRSLKTLLPLLALSVFARAQAIAPDPDPHTIDKSCLGPALIMNEGTNDGHVQLKTLMTSAVSLSPTTPLSNLWTLYAKG